MVSSSNEVSPSSDEPPQSDPAGEADDWEAAAVAAVQSFSMSTPQSWADLLAMTDDLTRLYTPQGSADADGPMEGAVEPAPIGKDSDVSPQN